MSSFLFRDPQYLIYYFKLQIARMEWERKGVGETAGYSDGRD